MLMGTAGNGGEQGSELQCVKLLYLGERDRERKREEGGERRIATSGLSVSFSAA